MISFNGSVTILCCYFELAELYLKQMLMYLNYQTHFGNIPNLLVDIFKYKSQQNEKKNDNKRFDSVTELSVMTSYFSIRKHSRRSSRYKA